MHLTQNQAYLGTFIILVVACLVLWLMYRYRVRARGQSQQVTEPPVTIPKEGQPRTLEELMRDMDVRKHYAFYPGWLNMDELDLLWDSAGFKVILEYPYGEGYLFEILQKRREAHEPIG
jgi:hypothetical protein